MVSAQVQGELRNRIAPGAKRGSPIQHRRRAIFDGTQGFGIDSALRRLLEERSAEGPHHRTLFERTCRLNNITSRQQVEGEGNSSGKNRHAAPVCRTHRMPSKHARFAAAGRPRLSGRRFGWGNSGSISCHCSSVNSFCRFFMAEAHHLTRLTRKCLMRGYF